VPKLQNQDQWSKYWDKAYGYFWRRLSNKSQIEDLVTESLHAFFLTEQKIDNEEAFFWAIVRNKFLAHLKAKTSKTRQITTLDEDKIFPNSTNSLIDLLDEYDPFYQEKVAKLLKCVQNQLTEQDASIVEMSVMCDFTSARVASELNLSAGNVRVRLSRALNKLREKCRQIWE
jgi:RNA polymerase sigma factor (sigma-70 family)